MVGVDHKMDNYKKKCVNQIQRQYMWKPFELHSALSGMHQCGEE